MLRDLGADEVVVIPRDGKFSQTILALTEGQGVDVVIDNVGSPVFWVLRSLALHGRIAIVGQIVGERVSFNLAHIFFKRAQLLGVGSVNCAQLHDAAMLSAKGLLHSHVDKTMPLEEVVASHELIEFGTVSGRIVLTMSAKRK